MYEVELKERIIGYSTSSVKSGEMAAVQVRGASSIEDGDLHIKHLEGLPQTVLSLIPEYTQPADIESMVVIISKNLKAQVYINELDVHGYAFVKAIKVEKDQAVTKDDIAGFERIILGDIKFPKDHAYFCVLSFGWDRAYVFDFSPLDEKSDTGINYDVEKYIGSYYSYLSFKAIHKITGFEWGNILAQSWFPFYSLKYSTIDSMVQYVRSGWDIDELIDSIEGETIDYIEQRMHLWEADNNLSLFVEFLKRAVERHRNEDYISSISIIYPKIEGLIRQDFIKDNPDKQGRKQSALIEHITEKTAEKLSALTTYIPDKFKTYLEDIYFKDFFPSKSDNEISRHSVAHGASSIDKYERKGSLLGLLVFGQIAQYLQQSSKTK